VGVEAQGARGRHTLRDEIVRHSGQLENTVKDEIQTLARPRLAEEAGRLFVEAIEEAGRHFGFRVPMTGEYKIGKNWKETH
jgi:DNA polymerase I-like protein with 3'-5' exonuclease and polymerase domains